MSRRTWTLHGISEDEAVPIPGGVVKKPVNPDPEDPMTNPTTEADTAERIFRDLLRLGSFYLSAIELDTHDRSLAPLYDGEDFEKRIRAWLDGRGSLPEVEVTVREVE